jgi:cytohesin
MDLSVASSNAAMCELFVQFGAPYTAREAAVFNRIEEVKRMVEQNPALLRERFSPFYYAKPGQGPTLLGIALARGYREMAVYLMDAGAPLDGREWYDCTLLHEAAKGGDPELIRRLVARGLDVDAHDEDGRTPLQDAVAYGKVEAVAALIEAGADVNAGKGSALRTAAQRQNIPIVQLLLAAGADPSLKDREGRTAASLAGRRVQTLLDQFSSASSRGSP